jgi:hypothetical protein
MIRCMNRTRGSRLAFLVVVLCTLPLAAQETRMGALDGNNAVFTGSPVTLIDWSSPANAVGSVNTASVAWRDTTTPCYNIFSVRFYAIPSNALASVMIAERGPFRAVNGINTVTLDPPVSVTPETYIGVRRLAGDEGCGRPYGTFTRNAGRALFSSDDFKGGLLTGISRSFGACDLTFTTYNAAGNVVSIFSKSYDPNYFEQLGASSFVNGDLPAGGKIVVSAFQKEFIVYGAVTDNHTNDPSLRIGND